MGQQSWLIGSLGVQSVGSVGLSSLSSKASQSLAKDSPKPSKASPDLQTSPQRLPRGSPEAPRAENIKAQKNNTRRDRFLEKYRRRKQRRISSWNLLNRSLLEDFAQNAQKNNKNRFPLLDFLTTFSIRISMTICKNGGYLQQQPTFRIYRFWGSVDARSATSTLVKKTTFPPM